MERFGIKSQNYPSFKLFQKGKDPISFSGEVTEQDLLKFTADQTGFWFGMSKFFIYNIYRKLIC